jgi:membrane-bound ClpP family serine protease
MKIIRIIFLTLLIALAFSSLARAQSNGPLAIVMTADGTIMPPMLEYFQRGIKTAEQRNAEASASCQTSLKPLAKARYRW